MEIVQQKILVTGGTGYFGSLLVEKLIERGEQVRVFDLNPFASESRGLAGKVDFIQGDIRDADAIRRACKGVKVVLHNAAQVPLAKNQGLFESVNRTGTRNVLRAAESAGAEKVLHISSSAVYGVPEQNPMTEATAFAPGDPYGRAKLEGEEICREFVARGLDVTIIRPRTIVGRGRLGIFQILFEWIYQGSNIPILGSGENLFQFIHGDDLVVGCLLAATRRGSTSYNLGAGQYGTLRATLEALCLHAGTGSRVVSLPMGLAVAAMRFASRTRLSPLAPYHSLLYGRTLYFDTTKARRELAWKPRYSNDQMLAEGYDWYKSHRDEVLSFGGQSRHKSAVGPGILRLARLCFDLSKPRRPKDKCTRA